MHACLYGERMGIMQHAHIMTIRCRLGYGYGLIVVSICWVRQRMPIDITHAHMIQSRTGRLPVLFFSATATTQVEEFHLALTTSTGWCRSSGLRFNSIILSKLVVMSIFSLYCTVLSPLRLFRLKKFWKFRSHSSSHMCIIAAMTSQGLGLTLLHPLCVVSMITGGIRRPSKPSHNHVHIQVNNSSEPPFFF